LLVSTVVATSLALASSENFVAKFGEFLAVLLYLFTPWTAINLVDFYLIRKGHYSVREIFNSHGMYGRGAGAAYGVRHRVRRDDPVLQHRVVEGTRGESARRRRCGDADRTAGIGARVHRRVPFARRRGRSPPGACRRRGLDPDTA